MGFFRSWNLKPPAIDEKPKLDNPVAVTADACWEANMTLNPIAYNGLPPGSYIASYINQTYSTPNQTAAGPYAPGPYTVGILGGGGGGGGVGYPVTGTIIGVAGGGLVQGAVMPNGGWAQTPTFMGGQGYIMPNTLADPSHQHNPFIMAPPSREDFTEEEMAAAEDIMAELSDA